jgi:5-methyltetrahydrofolate--homocysteine methyltransferase
MEEKASEFSRTSEEEQLYKDVLKGNKKTIVDHVKVCLAASSRPQKLLDEVLLPAINDVGAFFDQGRYFLPQLIASAESMKLAIEYLEPMLKEDSDKQDMPTVVIATVAGDVHDIGKNLVAMMLKNYGFTVIDLGKDVDTELIVKTAIEENAKIIGLSALMTTTMQEMRVVVKTAKEKGYTGKIMVGGAVVTQEFADEIGADGYSKDAAEAVKVAEQLCGLA